MCSAQYCEISATRSNFYTYTIVSLVSALFVILACMGTYQGSKFHTFV